MHANSPHRFGAAWRRGGMYEVGARVRLTETMERYPHFIAVAGMEGTVTESTDDLFAVRMDDYLYGAEDWNNEIHWYPSEGILPGDILEVAALREP